MLENQIIIERYNKNWPDKFAEEEAKLSIVLSQYIQGSIEHVGSTAVPGLSAKPIIDIMVGIQSLEHAKPTIEMLKQYGYCYYPYKPEVMHWFCKPTPEIRTHHLHLIPHLSPLWQERIRFREALKADSELANDYQNLKYQLATQFAKDRETYTARKWPFIKKAIKKSLIK
ncbi:GrpB family protein [Thalassotalea castellviae]|uniref:GrpB family protein n=1 Tax=Thalassotalea castellviae TaxID=3075612 RepID=A0ABU3A1U7_9GAMM|nr:GrpB family protein [Thalassotalea sp. W431]MDT0604150.1 GrpB family protein [Thalassotalea sp. W431]